MLAEITPVGNGLSPDNELPSGGNRPSNELPPITLPPIPGIWPPPGRPVDPGYGVGIRHYPSNPIVIPPPENSTLPVPPGTIWPPLPPELGLSGPMFILVLVLGVGYRWLVIEGPSVWPPAHVGTPK